MPKRLDGPLEAIPAAEHVRDAIARPHEEARSTEPVTEPTGHHPDEGEANECGLDPQFGPRSYCICVHFVFLSERDATAAEDLSQLVYRSDLVVERDLNASSTKGDVDVSDTRDLLETAFDRNRASFTPTAPSFD